MADNEIRKDDNYAQEFSGDELEKVSGGDTLTKISNGRREVVRRKEVAPKNDPYKPVSRPDIIEKQ